MFGGFAPLPLRLGGSPEEGWSAADFMRLSADVAAMRRTRPFAILRVSGDGGSNATLISYRGIHAPTVTPTVTMDGSQRAVITWPSSIEDDNGTEYQVQIRRANAGHEATSGAVAGVTTLVSSNKLSVSVRWGTGSAGTATVVVYADWGPVATGANDYGASPDKQDCNTETIPYAFNWYQELGASLGSAYGTGTRGMVHARKLALARARAAVDRSAERFQANCVPGESDALLDDWSEALAIPSAESEPRWLVRKRAATKLASVAAADLLSLEAACQSLLGDRFVAIGTNYGSALSSPPTSTPPTTAWSDDYDLGNGVWATQRCHVQVYVTRPSDPKDPVFLDLVNVQLMRLLDELLPAWATFSWSATDTDGFLVGLSLIGYDGL
jgi:hypothetical protein